MMLCVPKVFEHFSIIGSYNIREESISISLTEMRSVTYNDKFILVSLQEHQVTGVT